MSLGVAVFASVVLILAIYHKGFRKVLLWTGAVAAALALLAVASYFGYDRYSTWKSDRAAKRQNAAMEKGVQTCMLRLGTPMPVKGTTPDFIPEAYFQNLAACQAYPDLGIPPPGFGFVPDSLPSGYMLDLKGKVAPIPPGATIVDTTKERSDLSTGSVSKPKKETRVGLEAKEMQSKESDDTEHSLSQQKICSEQAAKFVRYKRAEYGDDAPTVEYTSHYDATTGRCYVESTFYFVEGKT